MPEKYELYVRKGKIKAPKTGMSILRYTEPAKVDVRAPPFWSKENLSMI